MTDKKVQFHPYIYIYRTIGSPSVVYCFNEPRVIYEHMIEQKRLIYEREQLRKERMHNYFCYTLLISLMLCVLYIYSIPDDYYQ